MTKSKGSTGFENRAQPLLDRHLFGRRVVRFVCFSAGLMGISLLVGILGYRYFEGFSWIDSFLNASMLLGGMGPVDPLHSTGGKMFAGAYALFSGVIFILASGLIFAPVLHRMFHKMHLDED